MKSWNASAVLADSASLTAGTAVTADITDLTSPTVLVELEDLEGAADDTVTVRVVGAAGTYTIDERTLSALGGYSVEIPPGDGVELESANGVTYSAEVRADA